MMFRTWEQRRFGGCLFLVIFSLGIFYTFVHCPLQEEMRMARQLLEKQEADMLAAENFLNAHPDLANDEKKGKERQLFLEEKVPQHMQVGAFMAKIQENAGRNGLRIQRISPGAIGSEGAWQGMSLGLEWTGEYFSLLDFLRTMESSPRFFIIESVEIEKQRKGTLLQGTVCFRIYAWGKDADAAQ